MAEQLAVTVNGEAIPQRAIDFELQRLIHFYVQHGMSEQAIREQLPAIRRRAIDQAVGAKLLVEESKRLDITVSAEDIDRRFGEMVVQAGGLEKLTDILKKQKLTVDDFKRELEQGRRVDKLVDQAAANVKDPTEEEIAAHFEAHKSEYQKAPRVLAQHILIKPKTTSETDRKAAREALLAIKERVASGKSTFSEEAERHSECPSGKEGGSLGWFGRGMMVPEFDKAVFDMEVGAISDLVETQFGYHLIYKTDEDKGGSPELSDVHDEIRDFLRHVRRGEAVEAYVAELRKKADISIREV
ncbi:MAG: peptidylprolyl isomerase [Kiritimatiellia bacterium]